MPVTSPPSITALPTPPDPADRSTFNARAYPWAVAQQTLATEVAAVAENVYGNAQLAEAASLVKNTDAFKGAYAGGTTYALGDSVIHGGAYWLSNVASNLGNTPADGSAQWSRVYDFSSRAQVHAAVLSM